MVRKCFVRLLAVLVVGLAALVRTTPAQTAWSPWRGPWNYSTQLGIHPDCAGLDTDEFSHAALIPDGTYRGMVLLWRYDRDQSPPACALQDTTTAWVFNPIDPAELLRISQQLQSDIFCSGLTWDTRGQLTVAGGLGSGTVPRETYRFRPNALGMTATVGGYPEIQYDSSFPPWQHLASGDMALPRYYPTLTTLISTLVDTATSGCADVPASSVMALGGPPCGPCTEGNEFWEFLGPTAQSWSCLFHPPIATISSSHQAYIPTTAEEFSLHPQSNPPSTLLDSYPRALQLSTGHVFMAFDVNSGIGTPPNVPGESWGIALKSSLFPAQPDSRLWRGPADSDRNYAPAVIMETRNGSTVHRNRVLVFGGSDTTSVHNTVNELVLGQGAGDPVNGAGWQAKQSLAEPRHDCNAVILPTGQVLITGGARSAHVPPLISGPGQGPVLQPELYDPGSSPTAAGTTQLMSAGNSRLALDQTSSNPTPRVYHHVATLLPDGRVFIAGGESCVGFSPQIYPEAKYSAETFSPPYLQHAGFKPVFNTTPNGPFRVNTPNSTTNRFTLDLSLSATVSTSLDKVVLIRTGAVTHHFDYSQRYIELEITSDVHQGGGQHSVEVVSPESTSAPLGWYMLFAIEKDNQDPTKRIPSVAQFIRLEL